MIWVESFCLKAGHFKIMLMLRLCQCHRYPDDLDGGASKTSALSILSKWSVIKWNAQLLDNLSKAGMLKSLYKRACVWSQSLVLCNQSSVTTCDLVTRYKLPAKWSCNTAVAKPRDPHASHHPPPSAHLCSSEKCFPHLLWSDRNMPS